MGNEKQEGLTYEALQNYVDPERQEEQNKKDLEHAEQCRKWVALKYKEAVKQNEK